MGSIQDQNDSETRTEVLQRSSGQIPNSESQMQSWSEAEMEGWGVRNRKSN